MTEQDKPIPDPEELLQLKNELLERWRQLPEEHQASMALVLLGNVLESSYGAWMVDALNVKGIAMLAQESEGEVATRLTRLDQKLLDQVRGMALLPDEIREQLPPLYSNEELGLDAPALVKYFTPDSHWTWYASEYREDGLFFGLVAGMEIELGYFTLEELAGARGPLGLPIERDLYFKPATLRGLKEMHEKLRKQW